MNQDFFKSKKADKIAVPGEMFFLRFVAVNGQIIHAQHGMREVRGSKPLRSTFQFSDYPM